MGELKSKQKTSGKKPEGLARTQAASPRLNVAVSALDAIQLLPVFFGQAVSMFHTGRNGRSRSETRGSVSGSEVAAQGVKASAARNTVVLRRAGFGHE